jgi:hypothetical protein
MKKSFLIVVMSLLLAFTVSSSPPLPVIDDDNITTVVENESDFVVVTMETEGLEYAEVGISPVLTSNYSMMIESCLEGTLSYYSYTYLANMDDQLYNYLYSVTVYNEYNVTSGLNSVLLASDLGTRYTSSTVDYTTKFEPVNNDYTLNHKLYEISYGDNLFHI